MFYSGWPSPLPPLTLRMSNLRSEAERLATILKVPSAYLPLLLFFAAQILCYIVLRVLSSGLKNKNIRETCPLIGIPKRWALIIGINLGGMWFLKQPVGLSIELWAIPFWSCGCLQTVGRTGSSKINRGIGCNLRVYLQDFHESGWEIHQFFYYYYYLKMCTNKTVLTLSDKIYIYIYFCKGYRLLLTFKR